MYNITPLVYASCTHYFQFPKLGIQECMIFPPAQKHANNYRENKGNPHCLSSTQSFPTLKLPTHRLLLAGLLLSSHSEGAGCNRSLLLDCLWQEARWKHIRLILRQQKCNPTGKHHRSRYLPLLHKQAAWGDLLRSITQTVLLSLLLVSTITTTTPRSSIIPHATIRTSS